MKQYHVICDDTCRRCGGIYTDLGKLLLDIKSLIAGHDDAHGHLVQVREVSEWVSFSSAETLEEVA